MNNQPSAEVELDNDFGAGERLFHYTSSDGLYGILQSGCLWATHFKFLNDSNEFFAARESLTDFVRSQIRIKLNELVKTGRVRVKNAEDLEGLCNHQSAVTIDAMYKAMLHLADPFVLSSFVSSPSERSFRNGELLHWATYGRDGGYALEINPHKLAKILPKASVLSLKAVYVDDSAPEQLSEQYSEIGKVAQEMVDGIVDGNLDEVDVGRSASPFMRIAGVIKDDYFRAENEARLLYMRMKNALDEPTVHIRNIHGRAIPYIKLFERELLGERSPIEAVIIGPHRDRAGRKEALEIFLEANGLRNIQIIQSEVPYVGG